MMEKKRKVALALSGLLLAAVLLSGCIDETPTKTVTSIPTSSPTPSPTPTPEATPPSPTPTPEVTPPILVKKEIHQDFDATPALAGLLYPSVSNLTPADIGFEVAMTDEINSLFDIGKPMVPYIIKIFEIPGDSDIELVSVNFSNPLEIDNVFIEPAQPPVIAGGADRDYWRNITPPPYTIDNETYASSEPYPGREYKYWLSSGDTIHEKRVVVHLYPIQYIPVESRIIAYKNASVSLVYWTAVDE